MRTVGFIVVAVLALSIGAYPALYFLVDMSSGFLAGKSAEVLASHLWTFLFNTHIIFGGIGLLIGWTQFVRKIRTRFLTLHRTLGKVYIISSMISGLAAGYLAVFATGGLIASLGFGGLAACWIYSTVRAFLAIRVKDINSHREWMTRSYALTFAAVALRLWLPILGILGMDFITSYLLVSWLCWVPNLLVAEMLIRSTRVMPRTAMG
jgi:uncharacterized membrane protein